MGSSGEGGSSSHEGEGGGGGGGEVMGSSSVMSGAGGGGLIGGEDDKSQGGDLFEAGDRSTGGNRWPRQETLALLKIRSDMDAVFRDSSLKGPLWEHISRKMAELGYQRSSKKCREKFENVYKYHKRTKDGRVGKSEGKTYRFFDQLEALEQHQPSSSAWQAGVPPQEAVPVRMVIPGNDNNVTVTSSPHPITVVHTPQAQAQVQVQHPMQHYQQQGSMPVNRSSPIQIENPFSSSATHSSSSLSGSDEEVMGTRRKKKKRKWEDFFERLAKEVIRKQEELHKNFIDVVERMDRDRIVREEAWKAREIGRLNQEREILAKERSMAAAKDAALMTFLQKLSTQSQVSFPFPVQIQTELCGAVPVTTGTTATITQHHPPPQPQPPVQQVVAPIPIQAPPQPQPQPLMQPQVVAPIPIQAPPQPRPLIHTPPALALTREPELVVANPINTNVEKNKTNNIGENQTQGSPSRWPKAEIEALINLRSKLDEKYQDSGPKGPLWEEISSSMKKLGYNRNAKRCKEKWENINKYFKKVKESNKRRPEDSKTCPYFHQLDALYRSKTLKMDTTGTSVSPNNAAQQQAKPENLNTMGPVLANPSQHWPIQDHQMEDAGSANDSDEDGDYDDDDEGSGGYEIVANAGVNSKTTSTTVTPNE